jgi:hypothetical protein
VNALPFLRPKGWPQLRKVSGVSKYGFSEDDDLIEQALDELIAALESKNHEATLTALEALIDVVMNKEDTDAQLPEGA